MNTIRLENFLNELCADEMSVLSLMMERKLKPTIEAKTSNHRVIQREHKLGSKVMCPHCKQYHTTKNGHTKIGRQKYYYCKPCDVSFSDTTGTIAFHSKKFYKHWHAFCGNEIDQLPLRKSAAIIGISTTTAFIWRQKIHATFTTLKTGTEKQLSIKSEADTIYFPINLKGTKRCNMPRESKARGTASKKRGISSEQVGVFSAIDDSDRTLVEIAGLGPESVDNLLPFKERFEVGSLLITDSKQAFVQFAKEAKMTLDQIPAGKKTSKLNNNLATINGLHGQIRHFFSSYRGVSTRHLQGYLDFFKYLHHLKYTTEYAIANNKMYNYSISSITKMLIKQIYSKTMPIDLKFAYPI